MQKKEYKIFLKSMGNKTEIDKLNSVSINIKINLITEFENFDKVNFFVFPQKSLKSFEYYYSCLFKNCTF